MFKFIIIICIFISPAAFADADDWGGFGFYGQNYGYNPPIVQEEIIATPRGFVEEEIVYVPQRIVEYQGYQQNFIAPVPNYNVYVPQEPVFSYQDNFNRW